MFNKRSIYNREKSRKGEREMKVRAQTNEGWDSMN